MEVLAQQWGEPTFCSLICRLRTPSCGVIDERFVGKAEKKVLREGFSVNATWGLPGRLWWCGEEGA